MAILPIISDRAGKRLPAAALKKSVHIFPNHPVFGAHIGLPAKVICNPETLSISATGSLPSYLERETDSLFNPYQRHVFLYSLLSMPNHEPDLSIATKHSRSHPFWKLGQAGREICQGISIYTYKTYEEIGGARGLWPARNSLQI